jgi:hypothetical protein
MHGVLLDNAIIARAPALPPPLALLAVLLWVVTRRTRSPAGRRTRDTTRASQQHQRLHPRQRAYGVLTRM